MWYVNNWRMSRLYHQTVLDWKSCNNRTSCAQFPEFLWTHHGDNRDCMLDLLITHITVIIIIIIFQINFPVFLKIVSEDFAFLQSVLDAHCLRTVHIASSGISPQIPSAEEYRSYSTLTFQNEMVLLPQMKSSKLEFDPNLKSYYYSSDRRRTVSIKNQSRGLFQSWRRIH